MRFITIFAAVLVLAGCAAQPVDREIDEAAAPLYCAKGDQCAAYWKRAAAWVEANRKFAMLVSDDKTIQTLGPEIRSPRAAFRVIRVPQPDGREEILLDAACMNFLGCFPNPTVAIASFKRYVRSDAL